MPPSVPLNSLPRVPKTNKIEPRKKPFHHRGTPTIKGPLYLILPQKYCHKIKYETSHSRQDGSQTHHVPRCILQRGEETTRVEKDDKRVELATRTAFNSHPPAARCYDHNMHHIPTEIISAMERHGTGAGPLAEKLRREGSRPD
ncbi:hypothetical protein JTE90_011267 [Oedothorax gibbosus]|uniref:Uncharacterized protein n=1 Tax=Oedothorax gibbosus TaxID=931172 RepID=A0AAV6TK64_9ARAC|nr:hypothetical protein JTE90_011267 [Oedothorax gibbosus]